MNLHLSPEKSPQKIFVCLRQWLLISICLALLLHVCAADNTAASTAGNDTDLAGMSFQQYIIDLDMSYADGILVQETWTLLPGNANVTLVSQFQQIPQ